MELSITTFSLIVMFISLVISISVHEMMHAFAGLKLGDTTAKDQGRISLNPLSHIDPFLTIILPIVTLLLFQTPILAAKPVPFNPENVKFNEFGAAIIALAGPLTNLALAALAALLLPLLGASAIASQAVLIFLVLNVALFVFNMVPIPPLDGSRVINAVAPEPIQEIMAQLEQFGFVIIFGLILIVPGFTNLIYSINSSIVSLLV